ncbi:unnamed protein product [Closterium sp. Yama58-4]|nr:unnamed protein product [Closterium sp. Yama58-4]
MSDASDTNFTRRLQHMQAQQQQEEAAALPMLPPPSAPQVVQCQRCSQLLEVPLQLPPAKKGVQKLRCGKCLRVSRFQVNPADPRFANQLPPKQRAGPIHPGNYWYDDVAGFWGEMGGPCLGIIPPGIDFGVVMPQSCAGGSTRVYVNGRELHHRDLERLMKRGLPGTPDCGYRIEITGNVFDEETGEYLLCLGKLAPSLESRKRGGGMKMPERS